MHKLTTIIFSTLLVLSVGTVIFGTTAAANNTKKSLEVSIVPTISNNVELISAQTTATKNASPKIEVIKKDTGESVIFKEQESETTNYSLTSEEIDLIALVTMGEAEGETELGKRLVIDTILNRVDDPHFPNTVHDVIYQPHQFSVMWGERIDRCYVMPEIVELVKEELANRTNYDCVFFMAGKYSKYGQPMFKECHHYFSSYN